MTWQARDGTMDVHALDGHKYHHGATAAQVGPAPHTWPHGCMVYHVVRNVGEWSWTTNRTSGCVTDAREGEDTHGPQ